MLKSRLSLLSLAAIVLLFFTNINCAQKERPVEIDFEEIVELKEKELVPSSEINICIGSMITPEEGYVCYKKLLDYIGQKLEMKINFVEKRTYAEVNALLEDGRIDVAFVCGGPYVIGHDKFNLELLVAPIVNEEPLYYSYIIVNKDSEIEKIEELKNKTFAFVDPLSNTGKLIPTYMLHELKEKPNSFFKEHSYTYGHDNSIKAVAQGIVDGAGVDSLIWQYMDNGNSEYTKKTKIIKISEPYGIPPIVVHPGLDEDLKLRLKNILLNMHNEEEGHRILERMLIDKFIEIDDSNYDTIREVRDIVGE